MENTIWIVKIINYCILHQFRFCSVWAALTQIEFRAVMQESPRCSLWLFYVRGHRLAGLFCP